MGMDGLVPTFSVNGDGNGYNGGGWGDAVGAFAGALIGSWWGNGWGGGFGNGGGNGGCCGSAPSAPSVVIAGGAGGCGSTAELDALTAFRPASTALASSHFKARTRPIWRCVRDSLAWLRLTMPTPPA